MSDFTVRVNVKKEHQSKDPKQQSAPASDDLMALMRPMLDSTREAMDSLDDTIKRRKREIKEDKAELQSRDGGTTAALASGAGSLLKGGAAVAGGVLTALGINYAIGKFADVAHDLVSGISEVADSLTEYSPELSQQKAISELQKIQQSVSLSAKYGQELADYMQSQTKLDLALEKLKADFSALIAPLIQRVADAATKIVEFISIIIDKINEVLVWLGIMAKQNKPVDQPNPLEAVLDKWFNTPIRTP